MLSRFPNWVRSGLLLALLAGSQTGCQTWKSPSFNMFPWSKKPSADKIVGTKPPTNLPSSPSSSSVSSLAQDTSKSGGPVSPSTRNTPSPVPGAAAANNGFTPGTYTVAQNPSAPGGANSYAANPYGSNPYAAMPNGSVPNAAIPNGSVPNVGMMPNGSMPMGSGPNAANPYGMVQAPSGQAGMMPKAPSNNNPYGSTLPAGPSGSMNVSFNAPPTQPNINYQNNIPNLPPAYGGPAYSSPVNGNQGLVPQGIPQGISQGIPQGVPQGIPQGMLQGVPQGMPQGVPQGIPSLPPAGLNTPGAYGSLPSLPTGSGLPPSSVPGTPVPPTASAPGMPSLPPSSGGAYRPGSVGRSTSYDFSGQNQVR
jgi:hypothetical protein